MKAQTIRWPHFPWTCLSSIVALLWLMAATSSLAQVSPPPHEIYFHDAVSHGGNGCLQAAHVEATLSEDGYTVRLVFDAYEADVGPNTSPTVRTFCTVSLPLYIPAGWQYTVIEIDSQRGLWLQAGVRGHRLTEIYFQGRQGIEIVKNYQGPVGGHYTARDQTQLGGAGNVWSPCNAQRNLVLRTAMRMNNADNRAGLGRLAIRSPTVYTLAWRPCE